MLLVDFSCSWGGQSDIVFTGLAGDFMKPRINEVKFYVNAFE